MLKNSLVGALLTLSVFVLNGCATNPADSVPSAAVKTPSTTASSAPAATATPVTGQTFAFVEGTSVSFVGSKVTGKHEGGFKKVEGTVVVPDGDLSGSSIELTIDMKSLWSDSEKLTGHLSNDDFFGVAKFPTSTFKSTALAKTDKGYDVTGDLTLKGVTQSITFPSTISLEGEKLAAKAKFSIDRTLFGIEYPGKPDDLIRKEVVIEFDLEAAPKA